MLDVQRLTRTFGGLCAVDNVSLTVSPGEVLGIIGPNGSGKSTFVNLITGYITPDSGAIRLEGVDIAGRGPARVRRAGIARTFQNLRLFDEMTAGENLQAGLHLHASGGKGLGWRWLADAVRLRSAVRTRDEIDATVAQRLHEVGLGDRAHRRVADLSYGEKKRLEIARTLLLRPRYIMLDEPTAGLSPVEASDLFDLVLTPDATSTDVAARGTIVIEHRLDLVLARCQRIVVFDNGRIIADGAPADVAADREVQRVYVGG